MNQASTDSVNDYEPDVLRVFQTKDETRFFYTKITHAYDLLAEHSEQYARGRAENARRQGRPECP